MKEPTIQIEPTESELIEWLCELAIEDADLPEEFTIPYGSEPEKEDGEG
jgi:hypothetical protein